MDFRILPCLERVKTVLRNAGATRLQKFPMRNKNERPSECLVPVVCKNCPQKIPSLKHGPRALASNDHVSKKREELSRHIFTIEHSLRIWRCQERTLNESQQIKTIFFCPKFCSATFDGTCVMKLKKRGIVNKGRIVLGDNEFKNSFMTFEGWPGNNNFWVFTNL